MLKLASPALFYPPEEIARLLSLSFLKEARRALRRIPSGKDPEALHDFRVALRRLRTCLRAYWPYVKDSVSKKHLGRLRDLARATAQGRDVEVEMALLSTFKKRLTPREMPGLRWLLEQLRGRKQKAYGKVLRGVDKDFGRIEGTLKENLAAYERKVRKVDPSSLPSFIDVTRALLEQHAVDLHEELSRISPHDEAPLHESRITAKRLRYLLEPFAENAPGGVQLVADLRELQDLLGDICDGKVVLAEIAVSEKDLPVEKPAEATRVDRARGRRGDALGPPNLRAGLARVRDLVAEREAELLGRLEGKWSKERAGELLIRVRWVAEKLSLRAADHPGKEEEPERQKGVEIERKFLLKELPLLVKELESEEIEQGWLPNQVLQERVRRSKSPKGEKYFRTFKAGMELKRVELEEEIPRDIFTVLWRLTKGRRVRKRRYRVQEESLLWEIDSFRDRDLVLAEVEIPKETTKVKLPGWLRRALVREVTGEPEFYNVNLAN